MGVLRENFPVSEPFLSLWLSPDLGRAELSHSSASVAEKVKEATGKNQNSSSTA